MMGQHGTEQISTAPVSDLQIMYSLRFQWGVADVRVGRGFPLNYSGLGTPGRSAVLRTRPRLGIAHTVQGRP
jgi:hypothetical protein